MSEQEKIVQVLYDFIEAGLIDKDAEKVVACMSPRLLGIGIGEQGFVTSLDDVRSVINTGAREESGGHEIRFGRIEVLLHSDSFATLCAEVCVATRRTGEQSVTEVRFQQLLTLTQVGEDWKICALHASTPVITEETAEAYPLRIADETLRSLKKKIGEQVYAGEEQYRQAILADTIAFYIVNLSLDRFEQCQCNSDRCTAVEVGERYSTVLREKLCEYVDEEDRDLFQAKFSMESLLAACDRGEEEVDCEYRLSSRGGRAIWAQSVARLVRYQESGDKKAVIYVRDIDERKREELELQHKAACDGMTGLYNKSAMQRQVSALSAARVEGMDAFIVLDVDRFKDVNDAFGHPAGDMVLMEVARLLQTEFRESDVVARIGGDEFAVFAPGVRDERALERRLGEMLLRVTHIEVEGSGGLRVTCSAGLALCGDRESFETMYARADAALYEAKKQGRDRVVVYQGTETRAGE